MDLQDFFPYRLAQLAETVSRAIAPVYARHAALSRDEWRLLAALSQHGTSKTTALMTSASLDKMQASRALARMEAAGLVEREPDPEDARARLVRPSAAARRLYRRIVPLAQAREAFLLEALSAEERLVLLGAMDKLQARAAQLARQG